jgi:hypothetical protein
MLERFVTEPPFSFHDVTGILFGSAFYCAQIMPRQALRCEEHCLTLVGHVYTLDELHSIIWNGFCTALSMLTRRLGMPKGCGDVLHGDCVRYLG